MAPDELVLFGTTNQDRAVLVTLYNAMNGPNWSNSNNWLTNAPLEDWYGVSLDASGRVREVRLDGNGLTGQIPPELGDLTNLQSLLLWDNGLTGQIPPELGNLTNLQYLFLSINGLTGQIPPELGKLAALERLSLRGNNLTSQIPPELGNLTNLERLYLEENGLTGQIPPELGNLAALENLLLGGNNLTGQIPPELGNLTNLTDLSLGFNNLTGQIPPELGDLTNLTWLSLSYNDLTGQIPLELANLMNLEYFYYDNTNLCVPNDNSFRTWLNNIPNHSGTGVDCQGTGAGLIFRDDFNNSSSLDRWTLLFDASAEVSGGILRLTNDSPELWGAASHVLDQDVTSWEVRARMGASAESMTTALTFSPTDAGELDVVDFRLQIGPHVVLIDGEEQTVNYRFEAFFTPEGRNQGWYWFRDFTGMSNAINDGVGDFTEIAVRVKDGRFEALAGNETLFSVDVGTHILASSLSEIWTVQFWSFDTAAANPGLLDWIEVTGVPSGSSANADRDSRPRLAQPDFLRDLRAVREVPEEVCLTSKCP